MGKWPFSNPEMYFSFSSVKLLCADILFKLLNAKRSLYTSYNVLLRNTPMKGFIYLFQAEQQTVKMQDTRKDTLARLSMQQSVPPLLQKMHGQTV